MNFNKFYSSLNDEQRKYYNKEIKEKQNEKDLKAAAAVTLNWFLIFLLICSVNNGGHLGLFNKKN